MIKEKIIKHYNKLTNKKINYKIKGSLHEFDIIIPFDHHLPAYQSKFRLYDKMLGKIAEIIYKHQGGKCVDIGANIGDTALAILADSDMEVICIEGDQKFYEILQKNTKAISKITSIHAFVGKDGVDTGMALEKSYGTGKLVKSNTGTIKTQTLESLLQYQNLETISLIKSDTDGHDFEIIRSMKNILEKYRPSLFFEYDFFNDGDEDISLQIIGLLSQLGYNFVVYDNFGNFMSCISSEHLLHFSYLNRFINSSKKFGGGIYYADIFATVHLDILDKVRDIDL